MRTICACGSGERSSLQCSMRGSERSSANRSSPETLAAASTFVRGVPTTDDRGERVAGDSTSVIRAPACIPMFACHLFDGFVDLQIPRAATEIAAQRIPDLLARGVRVGVEQRLRHEEEARRAVAALRSTELREGSLQRVQRAALRHAFNSLDAMPGVRLR